MTPDERRHHPLAPAAPPAERTVLCIDDDPDHAEILRRTLQRLPGPRISFIAETDPERALELLASAGVSIAFVDHRLQRATGAEVVGELRRRGFHGSVIVVSAYGSETVAAEALRAGADDYLPKSDLSTAALADAIARADARSRDRLEKSAYRHRLELLESASRDLLQAVAAGSDASRVDPVSGAWSRSAWEETASREQERCLRYQHPIALISIDVDCDDDAGAPSADEQRDVCLRGVVSRLHAICRSSDVIGRYARDRFVVLLPETGTAGAVAFAERALEVIHALGVELAASATGFRVAARCGVAAGRHQHWIDLLAKADAGAARARARE